MPAKDGTGPMGQGPLTGRGFGPCAGDMPVRRGFGQGFGRGFGRGFGYRRFAQVELTKEEKQKILKAELADIDVEKQAIAKELKELK